MSGKPRESRRNFTAIRKQFLRHLAAHDNVNALSKSFGALDSNFARVDFVLGLLERSKIEIDFQDDRKSDEESVRLRERGNEMYKLKRLKEAWECYTKSICCAEEGSVNLGLAYANRSAVLFELNLHKQCLTDIYRALEHNYPEHLRSKLFVREKNSKNLEFEAFKSPFEEVPIVREENSNIGCADSCVEICQDKNWGRFVRATRDIKVGEVLVVEEPFAVLLVNQYFSHCHECISLCYNLVPCKSCTHAMYCSENCRQLAFERYHKYECPIMATIKHLELDKLKVLPLRIAFLVRNQYNEIGDFAKERDEEVYQSKRYKEIHDLIANTSKRTVPDLFERATAAGMIFNLVRDHTDFFANTSDDFRRTFKDLLLLHMQTGPSNFHEITELAPNSAGVYEPEEVASGAFAFLSLLNHSCFPNVTRFCYGSTIVLRAIQNINKGEQCFDNYGYHYALTSKTDRKKQLEQQYHFDCLCLACEHDWPTYNELVACDAVDIEDGLFSRLSSADVETAEGVLEDFAKKLGESQETQPSRNFCQIQEVVKQCFAVFGNKRRIF